MTPKALWGPTPESQEAASTGRAPTGAGSLASSQGLVAAEMTFGPVGVLIGVVSLAVSSNQEAGAP